MSGITECISLKDNVANRLNLILFSSYFFVQEIFLQYIYVSRKKKFQVGLFLYRNFNAALNIHETTLTPLVTKLFAYTAMIIVVEYTNEIYSLCVLIVMQNPVNNHYILHR